MWVRIFDKYEISNSGVVRNVKSGRQIKQFQGKDGYLRIQIAGKTRTVHRLVAEAFIPSEVGKDFVNHKDGNKQNNNVENLEWCTRSENLKHAYKFGLKNSCGVKNGRSKLTESDVIFIREHYIRGDKNFGTKALAKRFGVARQTVSAVISGQNWISELPYSEIITSDV
jgi:hypothetical protein